MKESKVKRFDLTTYNGRFKILVDGLPMVTFNQIDYKGHYAFKDDHNLYCIDFYLCTLSKPIETSYKTKEVWLGILDQLKNI